MQHCNSQLITVVADDITGAAEIAGIGLRFGLRVHLVTYTGEKNIALPSDYDLLIYATDTRSMSQFEAVGLTTRLAHELKANRQHRLFKKTDSALRGHIVSELNALMQQMEIDHALLLPQNPSRERIIQEGIYYINNIPLNETSFSYDPEFPALTANVVDYFKKEVALLASHEPIRESGIHIANASSTKELALYASLLNEQILPAGGADFFTQYLLSQDLTIKHPQPLFNGLEKTFTGLGNSESIIVCGSTSKHSLSAFSYIRRKNIPTHNMPEDVFWGENPAEWIDELIDIYQYQHSLILQINHPPQEGRAFASRLRQTMSRAVVSLLSERHPQELIIEGGATAFAILGLLNWNSFKVEQEVSPGVIRIIPAGRTDITVTLKPGSYSWGELFY